MTIFKTENDPVSMYMSSHFNDATIATVKEVNSRNPHDMKNFLPD
jgi:hypothetical protein